MSFQPSEKMRDALGSAEKNKRPVKQKESDFKEDRVQEIAKNGTKKQKSEQSRFQFFGQERAQFTYKTNVKLA